MRLFTAALAWLVLMIQPAAALEVAAGSGAALPPLRFLDMQGNETGFEEFAGKVVVLNLWATWCAPCREEMPSLARLAAQLNPAEAVVVALSVDRAGPERVQQFLDEIGVSGLVVRRDPKAAAARELRLFGLPATLLVDREGREAGRVIGIAEWDGAEAVAAVRLLIERP